ncbi:bifunctional 3,4-dihydroxy-2-butanone-4-phosphate synthase/GTP cyclohydrolase II [Mycolicibacterium sp. P9-22]|uniref:bifunctional 3,4-dihydroxy-2-butanone-4-phosphate synthase/GTP cyclohydrolase II n=1 Tax=Mycolicibacterium sp. P9-22 TaxID=2024613 RepID=UPI0011EF1BA0|nr:bifunctional 3,4-dihydroxy-2-butanone-4-phosphate synthase/GTP cyclohydrolase II [Mycolicibacterium sp. P9-22]KAA0109058.1 bifunctional 3,4-dihydroxy-2-butanone-4-phosphate synthase/GTP cyclohydrolase II [Mycolicibacterium sp. P9-22]
MHGALTSSGTPFASIPEAIEEIAKGRAVIVVDDPDRENEGDLIFAAALATPELVAMCVRYTSGVLCTALAAEICDRLLLPQMVANGDEAMGTAYTISVDAKSGTTTGISAADRSTTIRALAHGGTTPSDLARPGHVFPLRARAGGVLKRPGHTEAAVDLAVLAGLPAAGVLAEIVRDDGAMARLPDLSDFAVQHNLRMITIADLVEHRRHHEPLVTHVAATRMPTRFGEFTAHGFHEMRTGQDHLALTMGDIADGHSVLTRVHSECLTGDVVGSLRCDCGPQLERALEMIASEGRGALIYMRGHEGRCIGLNQKLRAYALQDNGYDTVEANQQLGLPADMRDYGAGAQILRDLGVTSLRLLTNNPAKFQGLHNYGLDIGERVPLLTTPNADNVRYLQTKQDKLGHHLDLPYGLDADHLAN